LTFTGYHPLARRRDYLQQHGVETRQLAQVHQIPGQPDRYQTRWRLNGTETNITEMIIYLEANGITVTRT
jgi:hypothetical protein